MDIDNNKEIYQIMWTKNQNHRYVWVGYKQFFSDCIIHKDFIACIIFKKFKLYSTMYIQNNL